MRDFKETIFMGCGEYSRSESLKLVEKLKDALSWLSGFQQGAHDMSTEERKKILDIIDDSVRDIAMALTGKEIIFAEEKEVKC